MNYRNENSTPRDRYEGDTFSKNYRTAHNSYGTCGCVCSGESYMRNDCEHDHSCNRTVRRRNEVRPCTHRATTNHSGFCGKDNGHLDTETPIAMVYSPMQVWRELYDPETALTNGTVFKELDLPFYPTSCCRRKENSSCQCR